MAVGLVIAFFVGAGIGSESDGVGDFAGDLIGSAACAHQITGADAPDGTGVSRLAHQSPHAEQF